MDVATHSCMALTSFSQSIGTDADLVANNAVDEVLHVLQRHKGKAETAAAACAALETMARRFPELAKKIQAGGGAEAALAVARLHATDAQTSGIAVAVLLRIADHVPPTDAAFGPAAATAVATLRRHAGHTMAAHASVDLLRKLVKQERFVALACSPACIDAVLAAARKHPSDIDVFRSACDFFFRLKGDAGSHLIAAGAPEMAIAGLARLGEHDLGVSQDACNALMAMSCVKGAEARLIDAGICRALVAALTWHPTFTLIMHAACHCCRNLAHGKRAVDGDIAEEMVAQGVIGPLADAMALHCHDESLVEDSCAPLTLLARLPSGARVLVAAGVGEKALAILRERSVEHRTDVAICNLLALTLTTLHNASLAEAAASGSSVSSEITGSPHATGSDWRVDAAHVVLSVLQRFPDERPVATACMNVFAGSAPVGAACSDREPCGRDSAVD